MSFLNRDSNKNVYGETAFKKVTGTKKVIAANSTENIELTFPFTKGLIKGAKIINTHIGDSLNFKIKDTATNTYSQAPIEVFGANIVLNQFGFDVYLTNESLEDTAEFAGELYSGMILCCEYTNNTNESKTVYMNADIYELVME
tara:strand:- start:15806 stop:16237 length:432 start_codon:yes stop_codon:yes gene_type:complete